MWFRSLQVRSFAGIKEAKHKDFFTYWWSELAKLGYEGVIWDMFAADYGTPQRRPRTWFVAWPVGAPWGETLRNRPPATFGKPDSRAVTSGQMPPWVRAVDRLTDGCCGGFGLYSCDNLNNAAKAVTQGSLLSVRTRARRRSRIGRVSQMRTVWSPDADTSLDMSGAKSRSYT